MLVLAIFFHFWGLYFSSFVLSDLFTNMHSMFLVKRTFYGKKNLLNGIGKRQEIYTRTMFSPSRSISEF